MVQGLKINLLHVFEKENMSEEDVKEVLEKVINMYPDAVVIYMHCVNEFCHELFQLIDPALNRPLSGERLWLKNCSIEIMPIQRFTQYFGSKNLTIEFYRFCSSKTIDVQKIIQKYTSRKLNIETVRYLRCKPSLDEELEVTIEQCFRFIAEIRIEVTSTK